ncbi:phosphorylcholine transferase LicD [Methanomethylophilus alvi]|uniref:phosphorylcholine transferase LicD n=1 Tax=Methanomethylophilus alvi TaxID=1291540 RepID=UPI0037DD5742
MSSLEMMNETQSRLLSMYKDISKILDAHGIRYYLCYGSAIGAVRHDGFIPWDDDMDIWIWQEDLANIKKYLQSELDPKHYYYHDSKADTHPHVIYRGDDFEKDLERKDAPFIDLFPLVRYPFGRFRRLLSNISIWGIHISVTLLDHLESVGVYRAFLWVPSLFRKFAEMLVEDSSDFRTIYTTEFQNEIFPSDCFGSPVPHVFEDTTCYLAEKNDELLTHIFGDYMTPPPEDKRTGSKGFPLNVFKDYTIDKG